MKLKNYIVVFPLTKGKYTEKQNFGGSHEAQN